MIRLMGEPGVKRVRQRVRSHIEFRINQILMLQDQEIGRLEELLGEKQREIFKRKTSCVREVDEIGMRRDYLTREIGKMMKRKDNLLVEEKTGCELIGNNSISKIIDNESFFSYYGEKSSSIKQFKFQIEYLMNEISQNSKVIEILRLIRKHEERIVNDRKNASDSYKSSLLEIRKAISKKKKRVSKLKAQTDNYGSQFSKAALEKKVLFHQKQELMNEMNRSDVELERISRIIASYQKEIDMKDPLLKELRKEHVSLLSEIKRVDYMVNGRKGHYQRINMCDKSSN